MPPIAEKVGVIIPVYNRPRLVLKALDSVARQTVLPGKLIIVDDGSTDNTAKAVQQWIDNLQMPLNASLVTIQENRGVSAARNCGLQNLNGHQYVAMLDSDDLWPECYIERMTRRLDEDPNSVVAICDKLVLNTRTFKTKYFNLAQIKDDPIAFILQRGAGCVSNTMLRLKSVLDAGCFCENLPNNEDTNLFVRMALLGPWQYEPGKPVTVTRHDHIVDEEAHLSANTSRRMEVIDSFLSELSHKYPKRKKWANLLANQCYRKGRNLQKRKLYGRAHAYFKLAIRWKWLKLKFHFGYLDNLIRRTIARQKGVTH